MEASDSTVEADPVTVAIRVPKMVAAVTVNLQQHLESMVRFLQPQHLLKEVVKLESTHPGRIRYLAVIGAGSPDDEETCILGYDCSSENTTTLGLVVRIHANSSLLLDGDGGFTLCAPPCRQHAFKPVSVHSMWAVLQTIQKACHRAREHNHFEGGSTHRWVCYYELRINSDQSRINEWRALPDVESRRLSDFADLLNGCDEQRKRADTEQLIRLTLKEVMAVLDLDVVTSKDIRKRVEAELGVDLEPYKSFVDEEILTVLGQMDGASKIFDTVFLGSEWNAANLEELNRNGIGHILNVTREIDNFFPDQFTYCNVRVYDDEATELLKHWDSTYKYITTAILAGSKVLVHCKMGVSRSASVVIAYAMKAYHWDLTKALAYVKQRRSCVKPNVSFMHQLEIYAGILDASRQRHNKLWRSKSESNLKQQQQNRTPGAPVECVVECVVSECSSGADAGVADGDSSIVSSPIGDSAAELAAAGGVEASPPVIVEGGAGADAVDGVTVAAIGQLGLDSGGDGRPKSWSPDDSVASSLFPESPTDSMSPSAEAPAEESVQGNRAVGVNGRTYSVSQNRAVQLESSPPPPVTLAPAATFDEEEEKEALPWSCGDYQPEHVVECINPVLAESWMELQPESGGSAVIPRVGSVKDRICELESAAACTPAAPCGVAVVVQPEPRLDRTGLVLNIASQFGPVTGVSSTSPELQPDSSAAVNPFVWEQPEPTPHRTQPPPEQLEGPVTAQVKCAPSRHQAVLVRLADPPVPAEVTPAELQLRTEQQKRLHTRQDPFSWQLDRVFEREERRQSTCSAQLRPLRQHSWGCCDSARTCSVSSSRSWPPKIAIYASDPSLCSAKPKKQQLQQNIPPCGVVDIPPCGVVRKQRRALESLQQKTNRPHRSPEDSGESSPPHPAPPPLESCGDSRVVVLRSTSETSDPASNSSVYRLRKELEAKGLDAPPITVAAPPVPADRNHLRRRSVSVGKMNWRPPPVANRSATGSTPESASPSPPPRRSGAEDRPHHHQPAPAPEDDSDANVKLLVDLFETSRLAPPPPPAPAPPPARWIPLSIKPPVPLLDTQLPAVAPLAPPLASRHRKLHGKTHPLDRLSRSGGRHAHPVFGTM